MNTVKGWRAAVAASGFLAAFLFTGCGGGGGGSAQVAPNSLTTRSYTFNSSSRATTAVTFTTDTRFSFLNATGQVNDGNYTAQRTGNVWATTLISDGGGQQIFTMTFTAANGGSFNLQREGETDQTGSFVARGTPVASGTIENNTPPPNPGNEEPANPPASSGTAVYSGFSPVALTGRTLVGTRTSTSTGASGQTHTYTFTASTFHDSDPPEESGGGYTYTASNSQATLALDYNTPADFRDDAHTLTMTFTEKDKGTFQSAYTRGDGTQITISGNFQIQ